MMSCWLLLLFFLPYCVLAETLDIDRLPCLDSKHHKTWPSRERSLHGECAPWRDLSCCYENTSRELHEGQLYNFNFNHCDIPLSEKCSRYFRQEHCFFECSPFTSLWTIPVDMKTRTETIHRAPLCRSFCRQWFEACRHDLTCAVNWNTEFSWSSGTNKCLRKCQTFEQTYGGYEFMCQKIWNDSYFVVDDSEPCLLPWFEPGSINPNRAVAQLRSQQLNSAGTSQGRMYALLAFLLMHLISLM